MKRFALALLLLLSTICPLRAAELVVPEQVIAGAEEPIPLGEMAELSIDPVKEKPEHYVGSSYSWKVFSYDPQKGKWLEKKIRPFKDPDKEGVTFGAGIVKCKLKAICSAVHLYIVKDKDGKVVEFTSRQRLLSMDVVIGEGTEPDPVIPPVPVPAPDSELVKVLKKAYESETDTDKANLVGKLAALYRQGARAAMDDKTMTSYGDLLDDMAKAAVALGCSKKLLGVQEAISKHLKATRLPSTTDSALTDDVRKLAKSEYEAVAKALEAVK